MLDMNRMINEETERVVNSKQNRAINEEANKLANQEINNRKCSKPRIQFKQKDPVVAWLESQQEVDKVYLDEIGFITSVDLKEDIIIHETEVIEYKSNSNLDEFMKS